MSSSTARNNNEEALCEGWLTKSPPTNRLWRGRWRRRWFRLHLGELPNQYVLSYFTDDKRRRLKGFINLDDCYKVSSGWKFSDKKQKYEHMFDIQTTHRRYYLAAESDKEMKLWVKLICQICRLKCENEEQAVFEEQSSIDVSQIPPASPVSSDPYINISDCITGPVPFAPNTPIKDFKDLLEHNMKSSAFRSSVEGPSPTYTNCDPAFFDSPKLLPPPKLHSTNSDHPSLQYTNISTHSPLQSPTTDNESVFTDDDWSTNTSRHNKGNSTSSAENLKLSPPPRPPKPNNYLNLPAGKHAKSNSLSEEAPVITDDMYDFPRYNTMDKPGRVCYNNATVNGVSQIFVYDGVPKANSTHTQIFNYDDIGDVPASPLSQTSSTAQYSNLPSPLLLPDTHLQPPPKVNRELKPRRKMSDTHSIASSTEPPSPHLVGAPSVDRKLKPPLRSDTLPSRSSTRGFDSDENVQKIRAAPSPKPPSSVTSNHRRSYEKLNRDQLYYYHTSGNNKTLDYLDLDLDSKAAAIKASEISTVYKLVDFMKTDAIKKTKESREGIKQDSKYLKNTTYQ